MKSTRIALMACTAALIALTMGGLGMAQQSTANGNGNGAKLRIQRVHIKWIAAHDGQQMYKEYCASCHGEFAKGDGPAAPALDEPVPDLTLLAARNNGEFPHQQVQYMLTTRERLHPVNADTMPNWREALRSLDRHNPQMVELRGHNLAKYLETVQVKPQPAKGSH